VTRSLPCRKSSVPARVVTALGFAIVAVSLSTGAAAASGVEGSAASAQHQEVAPAHAAQALCERLTEAVPASPVAEAVVPVCKLVNGWD
jgi:hypothetical protein